MKELRKLELSFLLIGALMLGSCTNNKKVENFAVDFGQKASAGQIDSIKTVYPDAALADSIGFQFSPDSVTVTATEVPNTYNVNYGNGVSAVVVEDENGSLSVKESYGMFIFPKEDIDFAKKTGAINDSLLTDVVMLDVIGDMEDLRDYITDQYEATHKKQLSVKIVDGYVPMLLGQMGDAKFVVTNTGSVPVKGSDYGLRCNTYGNFGMGQCEDYPVIMGGKDLEPGETKSIPFDYIGVRQGGVIIWKNQGVSIDLDKDYQFTGKEYEEYSKANADNTKAAVEKLSDGPYNYVGKMGGKYPVHLTIDKGNKSGSYYYDKMGAKNTLSLSVTRYSPKTGKIKIEERDSKGKVTGTMSGVISPTKFEGKLKTSAGKNYDFTLYPAQ